MKTMKTIRRSSGATLLELDGSRRVLVIRKPRDLRGRSDEYAEGYHHGVLLHEEIQTTCDVWLAHTLAEMVGSSSGADPASKMAAAHEAALHGIVDIIIPLIYDEFRRSVYAGAIPRSMIDEMEGIVAGVRAMGLKSPISIEQIVAVNYGIDFVLRGVYANTTGRPETCELVKLIKSRLSASAQRAIKMAVRVPDMCNTAMVKGRWMLRDFSYPNGMVFHKHALIIVRQREGTMSVAMPGMVGSITAMSMSGMAVALNLVRSTHVSSSLIGLNSLLMVRHLATAASVSAAEELVNSAMVGVPWLYSCMDQMDAVVFETVVASVDLYPPKDVDDEERATLSKNPNGVYARRDDGDHIGLNDAYNFKHTGVSSPRFESADDESDFKARYGAGYFQPPADPDPAALVVANDFRRREPRMTQRGEWVRQLQATASRPQWRYEEMMRLIAAAGDEMTLEKAKDITSFSVWTQDCIIQGFLAVLDMSELVMHIKIGHMNGAWTRVDLGMLMKI